MRIRKQRPRKKEKEVQECNCRCLVWPKLPCLQQTLKNGIDCFNSSHVMCKYTGLTIVFCSLEC